MNTLLATLIVSLVRDYFPELTKGHISDPSEITGRLSALYEDAKMFLEERGLG